MANYPSAAAINPNFGDGAMANFYGTAGRVDATDPMAWARQAISTDPVTPSDAFDDYGVVRQQSMDTPDSEKLSAANIVGKAANAASSSILTGLKNFFLSPAVLGVIIGLLLFYVGIVTTVKNDAIKLVKAGAV